jgi:hypothetical protein
VEEGKQSEKRVAIALLLAMLAVLAIASVVLYAVVHNVDRYGFMMTGGAIGWTLYFFMRLFRVFSPQTLTATIGAVLGGAGLGWLVRLSGNTTQVEIQYYTGLGIGFLIYALYAGFCSWLFAIGIIKTRKKFEVAIGCGAGVDDGLDEVESVIELEDALKKWVDREITEEEFKAVLANLQITFRKLGLYLESGTLNCTPAQLERLKKVRFLPYLKSGKSVDKRRRTGRTAEATPPDNEVVVSSEETSGSAG